MGSCKIHCKGGKTKQSMKDETDVNVIVRRNLKTHVMPILDGRTPVYGDFTKCEDYQSCLDTVKKAEMLFRLVPAALRRKLNYNPANLEAYVKDEKNRDEMVKYGLIKQTRAEREIEKVALKTAEAKKNEFIPNT